MLLRQASSSRFREVRPVLAWISCASSLPAVRSSSRSERSSRSASPTGSPTRPRSSPSTRSRSTALRLRSSGRSSERPATSSGHSLVSIDAERGRGHASHAFPRWRASPSIVRSRTRSSSGSRPSGRSPSIRRGDVGLARDGGRQGRFARSRSARSRRLPRLWLRRGATIRVGGQIPAGLVPATRALAEAHAAGIASRVKGVRTTGDELTLVLRHGTEIRLGRAADVGMKLVDRAQGARPRRRRHVVRRRQRPAATGRRLTFNSQVEP